MNPLRIVFMGTPSIAVPTLEALIEGPHEVIGVFCQPDKQKGRGKKVAMPETKIVAVEHNIPVYQPVSLRNEESEALLKELNPDLVIVIAYGKILPPWLIRLPRLGCINLHASLLPKYRGAAPIQYAVWHEEKVTGMTIMQMDDGLDTGDMLKTAEIAVDELETSGTLFERLAQLGGSMINDTLEELLAGELTPVKQDDSQATVTGKITKDMGLIDWKEPAHALAARIRAFNPSPGCYSFIDGKRLKFHLARAVPSSTEAKPGTVIAVNKQTFIVATGEGAIEVLEVQPDNKKRMVSGDFIRGHQLKVGSAFEHNIV